MSGTAANVGELAGSDAEIVPLAHGDRRPPRRRSGRALVGNGEHLLGAVDTFDRRALSRGGG